MKFMRKFIFLLSVIILTSCSSDQSTIPVTPEAPVIIAPLAATFTQIDVAVYGGNTGSIKITPSGGTPPYTISPLQTGLIAGNYTFNVTDSKGLAIAVTTIITQPIATIPQSGLLKPAVKNINNKSSTGRMDETIKRLVQSIQYNKDKFKIDESSNYSFTDNLYSANEDLLNVDTPKGDVRSYTYNDLGQLTQISIQKGRVLLVLRGLNFHMNMTVTVML
jgi:YD repeat-containing protein